MNNAEKRDDKKQSEQSETKERKLKLQVRSLVNAPAGDRQASWSANCPTR